ncbi:MAG: hypothetical protein ACPGEF_08005, partial [Endozoicomonas sp.]
LLLGCAHNPWESVEYVELADESINQIAQEAVGQIKNEFPPAQTTLGLYHLNPGAFGLAFENALREAGYAVAQEGETKSNTYQIAYYLDRISDTELYRLSIKIDSGYGIDRLYKHNESGDLIPATGFAVRNDKEKEALTPKVSKGVLLK